MLIAERPTMTNLRSDLRLILLGPPGSGKGTQAQYICRVCDVGHVSTGDLLRRNTQKGTELGKTAAEIMKAGELVPDELIHEMLAALYERSGGEGVGFVLDGFPRAESQAQALEEYLTERGQSIHKVLLLELADDAIVGRLVHRRTCPKCGKSYHLKASPPKVEGRCDEDGTKLVWRPDDTEDVIRNRLATYHKQTEPVAEFYRKRGLLASIDAARPIDEVREQITVLLESLKS